MSNIKYDVKSEHAAEFIHDGEIRATLEYGREHRNDRALIEEILAKAEEGKGISHREAAALGGITWLCVAIASYAFAFLFAGYIG